MSNYRHLSYQERVAIKSCLTKGSSIRLIGEEIGRAPSTISRERRRNGFEIGYYSPIYAEQIKDIRRQKCRRSKIEKDPKRKAFIIDKLKKRMVSGSYCWKMESN